jgi:hypothetical protein
MKINFKKIELWLSFNEEKKVFTIQIENLDNQINLDNLLSDDDKLICSFFSKILNQKKVIDFYREKGYERPVPSYFSFDVLIEGPTVWLYDELNTR